MNQARCPANASDYTGEPRFVSIRGGYYEGWPMDRWKVFCDEVIDEVAEDEHLPTASFSFRPARSR
jgi:hypothetical protein